MKEPLSQSLAVAFGSNLGDRVGHFCLAVRGLEEVGIHLEAFSSILEISPHLRDPETGWQVHEVAQLWPLEPREIQMVVTPEAFKKAMEARSGC